MQSTGLTHHVFARTQVQVVGVPENHLSPGARHLLRGQTAHGAVRTDGHVGRRIDDPVRGVETRHPGVGTGICGLDFEANGRVGHFLSVVSEFFQKLYALQ